MPTEAQDLEKAYSSVLATSPDRNSNVRVRIKINAPDVREAFRKAAAGIDTVTDTLASKLTGTQTHVYRSDPSTTDKENSRFALDPLFAMVNKKIVTGTWGAADVQQHDRLIREIAVSTHLHKDHLLTISKDYEQQMRDSKKYFADNFLDAHTTDLKRKIGGTIIDHMLVGLSPSQTKEFQNNIELLAKESKLRLDGLINYIDRYEETAKNHKLKTYVTYYDDVDSSIRGMGRQYEYDRRFQTEEHISVPQYTSANRDDHFQAWFVNPADPPNQLPPGSKEMGMFLINLHETQHVMQHGPAVDGLFKLKNATQQRETESDYAIIKFADEIGQPEIKNYWLQMRSVNAVMDYLTENTLNHDTATFLRVYEKTGKQIDIDAFRIEKEALIVKIKEQLGDRKFADVKTADVVGAVKDILKDSKQNLSPVQKAEAESFIKDAESMGYGSNSNYKIHASMQYPELPLPPAPPPEPPAAMPPIKKA